MLKKGNRRNTKLIDGREVSYSSDWILNLESEEHFLWYHRQARIVYENCAKNQSILEIGVGTSLLSDLLKRRGWNIRTLDIDEKKTPDYCSDALSFDYSSEGVEVVIAFEIFEHIPFTTFEKVIRKLREGGVKEVYFSLPWNKKRLIEFWVKFPKLPSFRFWLGLPIGKVLTTNHFWELSKVDKGAAGGKNLISLSTMKAVFHDNGFSVRFEQKSGRIQFFSAKRKIF